MEDSRWGSPTGGTGGGAEGRSPGLAHSPLAWNIFIVQSHGVYHIPRVSSLISEVMMRGMFVMMDLVGLKKQLVISWYELWLNLLPWERTVLISLRRPPILQPRRARYQIVETARGALIGRAISNSQETAIWSTRCRPLATRWSCSSTTKQHGTLHIHSRLPIMESRMNTSPGAKTKV